MANKRGVEAGRAYVKAWLDDNAVTRGLTKMQARFKRVGASLGGFGSKAFGTGVAAALPFAAVVKSVIGFDDAIRATAAVSGAAGDDFERLRGKALELGRTTSFTAAEVAGLMTELGRAGFKPRQIEAMTGAVLDLARATGTDAVLASGIMAATMRQFGLGAEEAVRAADGLTAAANKSFNSVEGLGEALSYVGPEAAAAGMSLEETLAILGSLGNIGIQGSSAGTTLKRLLVLSGAEAKKWNELFGISALDAAGDVRPLVDILAEVDAATKDLGTGERADKFNQAFGLLGITGAGAIGKAAGDTRELLKEIQAATGGAAKTSADMDGGIGGVYRRTLSAIEGAAISAGTALTSAFEVGGEWIQRAAAWLTLLAAKSPGLVRGLALAAAGLIALGVTATVAGLVLGGLSAVAGFAAGAIGLVGTVLGFLLSPLGLAVVAVAALAGGALYLAHESGLLGDVLDWLGEKFAPLADAAKRAFAAIKAALAAGDFQAAARVLWAALKLAWTAGTAALMTRWLIFTREFKNAFADAAAHVRKAWAALTGGLTAEAAAKIEAELAAAKAANAAAVNAPARAVAAAQAELDAAIKAVEELSAAAEAIAEESADEPGAAGRPAGGSGAAGKPGGPTAAAAAAGRAGDNTALEVGSAEAQAAVAAAMSGGPGSDPVVAATEKVKDAVDDAGDRIVDALDGQPSPAGAEAAAAPAPPATGPEAGPPAARPDRSLSKAHREQNKYAARALRRVTASDVPREAAFLARTDADPEQRKDNRAHARGVRATEGRAAPRFVTPQERAAEAARRQAADEERKQGLLARAAAALKYRAARREDDRERLAARTAVELRDRKETAGRAARELAARVAARRDGTDAAARTAAVPPAVQAAADELRTVAADTLGRLPAIRGEGPQAAAARSNAVPAAAAAAGEPKSAEETVRLLTAMNRTLDELRRGGTVLRRGTSP